MIILQVVIDLEDKRRLGVDYLAREDASEMEHIVASGIQLNLKRMLDHAAQVLEAEGLTVEYREIDEQGKWVNRDVDLPKDEE